MIRPAAPQDAPAIAAIWNTAIRTSTATFTSVQKDIAEIEARIAQGLVVVAGAPGHLLGFATYGPFRAGPGYATVAEHSIYLSPEAQGKGVGRALLSALEDAARRAGIAALIAAIGGENPGAVAFHTACGFVQVGLLPKVGQKFGRRHDLILMQKAL